MKGADSERWQEWGLRRPLTPQEWAEWKALQANHPETRETWETELRLNQALRQLPNQPVSTNFTDQVMQAVHRECARRPVPSWLHWWPRAGWKPWIRPAVLAGLVLAAGGVGYHQHVSYVRHEIAQSLVTVAGMLDRSSPELVRDFDTLQRLAAANAAPAPWPAESQPASVDYALLALLE